MAWTVDDVLSNMTLTDAKIYVREVTFHLGDLSPRIRIRLFRRPGDKEIYFEQSHLIQTPDLASPYVPRVKSDSNEAYALSHAIEGLTHCYDAAVMNGHEPSDAWLKQNEDF